jgi:hypothetical protein
VFAFKLKMVERLQCRGAATAFTRARKKKGPASQSPGL